MEYRGAAMLIKWLLVLAFLAAVLPLGPPRGRMLWASGDVRDNQEPDIDIVRTEVGQREVVTWARQTRLRMRPRNSPLSQLRMRPRNSPLSRVRLSPDPPLTRDDALKAVKARGDALKDLPSWSADKEIVRAAVGNAPSALQYAAPELRRNRNFVLEMIQWKSDAFRVAKWKADRDFVLDAMVPLIRANPESFHPYALIEDVSPQLLQDNEFVYAFIERAGDTGILVYTKERSSQERGDALRAVRQAGNALKDFPRWSADQEIVRAAVENRHSALQYAAPALRKNADFVRSLVELEPSVVLQFADLSLRDDPDFVLDALVPLIHKVWWDGILYRAIKNSSPQLLRNKDFVDRWVERSGTDSIKAWIQQNGAGL